MGYLKGASFAAVSMEGKVSGIDMYATTYTSSISQRKRQVDWSGKASASHCCREH